MKTRLVHRRLGAALLLSVFFVHTSWSAEIVLKDSFGVAHPDQIVLFEAPMELSVDRHSLWNEAGEAVLFQVLGDGRIALRTDLPEHGSRRWTIRETPSPALPTQVSVTELADGWEIANERLAIRIPAAAAAGTAPAPVQGLRLPDGSWTALGPNVLDRPAHEMRVEWLEQGPLLTRVRVYYTIDRALLRGAREPEVMPAGTGFYQCTIEVQAGQPSILFEEEGDAEVIWSIPIYDGLMPDQARYRGHHSDSIALGRDMAGNQYGTRMTGAGLNYSGARGQDAIVDIDYASELRDAWSQTRFRRLAHWDPWAVNSGWYWQLFNTEAEHDNLLGIFSGPASRLVGPGWSGVSLDARLEDEQPTARLQVKLQRLKPTQFYDRHMRFGWGLYLDRRSTSLAPPNEVQEINRQFNLHSGVNLSKLAPLPTDFPDPPQGYGSIFVKADIWKRYQQELADARERGDTSLLPAMIARESSAKLLIEFWNDPSQERIATLHEQMIGRFRSYLETLINGEGFYRHEYCYFMGCLRFSSDLLLADQLLGSGQLEAGDARELKQYLALVGVLLWDNDLAPFQAEAKVNYGPANMPAMVLSTRYKYTAFLANHPLLAPRVPQVRAAAVDLVERTVNEAGSSNACPHYSGASMVPVFDLLQQLQVAGVWDGFAELPQLKRHGEWELQLLTPPDPRFGGLRKMVCFGDGSTEAVPRHAQLGTGFAPSDPLLSSRLMGSWHAQGKPYNAFHGTALLKIDDSLPAVSPQLGDAWLDGSYGVLRDDWDGERESAAWLVSGDWHFDHRHNDQGTVIYYALGSPLSLDWGPIYYPRVAGSMMHSTITPEFHLQQPWDADRTDLAAGPYRGGRPWWQESSIDPLQRSEAVSTMGARYAWAQAKEPLAWQRRMSLHRDLPCLVIDDEVTAGRPVVSTLLLMAEGAVETPDGAVTPPVRFYNHRDSEAQELPSALPGKALAAGWHRFAFTGQWEVDFDLYVYVAEPAAWSLGNWGHNWHPGNETRQFQRATQRSFEERQHILRLRGEGRFCQVIVPWRKDEPDSRPAFSIDGAELRLSSGDRTQVITPGE